MSSVVWLLVCILWLVFLASPFSLQVSARWEGGRRPAVRVRWWRFERCMPQPRRAAAAEQTGLRALIRQLAQRAVRWSIRRFGLRSVLIPAQAALGFFLSRMTIRDLDWRSSLAGQPPHRAAPLAPALWTVKNAVVRCADRQGMKVQGGTSIQVDPALNLSGVSASSTTLDCTIIVRPLFVSMASLVGAYTWVKLRLVGG